MVARRLTPLAALAVLLASAGPAEAYHTEAQRVTADTAETLGQGEWVIGMWRVAGSPWDALDIETIWATWIVPMPNLTLKARVFQDGTGRLSLAAKAGLYWAQLGKLLSSGQTESEATLFILPLEAAASWRFDDDWTWSLQTVYSAVGVRGNYDGDIEGIAAVSNLQVATTFEWRATRVTALYLHARGLLFQDLAGSAVTTVQVDAFTTAEIHGSAATDAVDVEGGWSAILGLLMSWETFNFRFGLGYGNWSLPGINLVVPELTPIVELDLFWRF